jgi:general secretion pathway protein N
LKQLVSRLALLGTLTCLVGLVVLFPARVAYHWFAPSGLLLNGIDGSVWLGSAASGMANGIYVRDLSWRIKPHRLLKGQIAYAIEALPAGGFVDGEIGLSVGGSLHLQNFRGSIPLAMLQPLIGIPGLTGTVNASIESLAVTNGLPSAGDGNVDVAALVLPIIASAPLGNFRAEFQSSDDGGIVANVQDTQAVMDLAGRLLLGTDRTYEFLGRVAATPDTPDVVRRQFQFLGTPNAAGQYELRLEGQL